jgi:hypothetical protein
MVSSFRLNRLIVDLPGAILAGHFVIILQKTTIPPILSSLFQSFDQQATLEIRFPDASTLWHGADNIIFS